MMSVWSMSSPVSPIRVRQQAAGLAPEKFLDTMQATIPWVGGWA